MAKQDDWMEKLNSDNQQSEDLHCEYSGLPSPKAYENVK